MGPGYWRCQAATQIGRTAFQHQACPFPALTPKQSRSGKKKKKNPNRKKKNQTAVKWLKHVVTICESQPIVRTREKGKKREGERNLRGKKTFTESQKWVSSSLRAGTEKRSVFSTPYLRLRDARPELSGKGTGLERILRALRTPGSPSSAVFFFLLLRQPPFLSQVGCRTGSAAGSGGGMQITTRNGELRRQPPRGSGAAWRSHALGFTLSKCPCTSLCRGRPGCSAGAE